MQTENCFEHKMEFVGSGEYYTWDEDILMLEHREAYECENCGMLQTFVEDANVS